MPQQKYRVVRRLDAGGMAEVYLGEAESLQGFKKKVAIKRVLPELTQNRQFIGMFLDEARIGLHLNHANVVQIFDIGVADDTYFIVMEYVDGVNLKTILEATRQEGRAIPVPQAVYVLIEVCKALSYAHELTDENGRPRSIVHRDVSPPNVLLSKQGEVKLVDFGLAKAVGHLEQTDPGIIKGKFSYLSPEAVCRQEVDGRADIFAAGILLWEILTNRRLFFGETDLETVELIQRAEVPSIADFNPQVPPALEAVVRRALAQQREHRYSSAREFSDALAEVLFAHGLKVTNFDIGNLVTRYTSRHAGRSGAPSRIDRLIEEELLRFTTIDEPATPATPAQNRQDRGAQPLEGGDFEDPGGWVGELFGRVHESAPERKDPTGGSGMIASTPPPQRPSLADDPNLEPGGLANALESERGSTAPSSKSHRRASRRRPRTLVALLVLLLAALAAVVIAIVKLGTY